MLKTWKAKLAVSAVSVDLFFYWLVFHSGVVLPFINPSEAAYAQRVTSFPRDAGQHMLWIFLHGPTSVWLGEHLGDQYLPWAIGQTAVICLVIGAWLDRRWRGGSKV